MNQWVTPGEILEPDSEIIAVGPQVYEASRLANFTSLDDLTKYTKKRDALGMEQFFTVYILCNDGIAAIMPGK